MEYYKIEGAYGKLRTFFVKNSAQLDWIYFLQINTEHTLYTVRMAHVQKCFGRQTYVMYLKKVLIFLVLCKLLK